MKDRDVPIDDFLTAFSHLGFSAAFNSKTGVLSITKPGTRLGTHQHLHKGAYDTVRRATVRAIYRRMGVKQEDFYKALDAQ